MSRIFASRAHFSSRLLSEYATLHQSAAVARPVAGMKRLGILLFCGLVLSVSLLPHIGIIIDNSAQSPEETAREILRYTQSELL